MGYDEDECAICYSLFGGNVHVPSTNQNIPICFLCMHEHLTDGFCGRMKPYLLTSTRYVSDQQCLFCHENRHMLLTLPICNECIPTPNNNDSN